MHYVCPSCGTVGEIPAACNTNGCAMIGQEMLQCACTDGSHGEIMNPAV